jgi:hypothetical protein
MKRVLRWGGIGCGGLLALGILLVLIGFLLPSRVEVGTEAHLEAPPDVLFPLLSTHAGLQRWWAAAGAEMAEQGYPALAVSHAGGPTEGPGLEVTFSPEGSSMEMERWTLTASEPPARVEYDVDFQIFVVHRTITLRPGSSGTDVTWHETGEIGNPLIRWSAMLMGDDQVVENFRAALKALDAAAARP